MPPLMKKKKIQLTLSHPEYHIEKIVVTGEEEMRLIKKYT